MDLSAVIFVVLALAWAVYLIPKALQHHDEVAAERLEESESGSARVLSRRETVPAADAATPVEEPPATGARPARSSGRLARLLPARGERPALSAAGRAARRRRRVLGMLLGVLAVVAVLTGLAVVPAITPLWPALAVVGWLVLARVSVVRMQRTARSRPAAAPLDQQVGQPFEQPVDQPVEQQAPAAGAPQVAPPVAPPAPVEARLGEEVSVPEADPRDALWDPLPLTLPTYVGKATARRTVRTIELTGVTSSGHDAADSALAAQTAEDEAHQAGPDAERRVAGA